MRHEIRQGFWKAVGNHPFAVLLGALFLMLVLAPSLEYFGDLIPIFSGMRSLTPLSLLVVAASMLSLWQRARHHALNSLAVGLVILLLTVGSALSHRNMIPIQLLVQVLFLGYVLGVVVRSVFTAKNVTGDVLCGSICIYLLTGIIAGLIFVVIEFYMPGSFRVSNWGGNAADQQASFINNPGWLLYFSFVTLTTVGYGDVLPDSSLARSASVIVAVIGQILLMVMIARLVGINVVQDSSRKNPDDPC